MPRCISCLQYDKVNKVCKVKEGSPVRKCVIALLETELNSQIKKDMKVLEIGCGAWDFAKKIIDSKKANWYGIDPLIEDGKNRKVIATHKGSVDNIPFDNDYFDYVLGTQSMEHWSEWNVVYEQALNEIYRVLKVGGILSLNFPIHLHGDKRFLRGNLDFIFELFDRNIWFIETLDYWRKDYEPLEPYYGYEKCGYSNKHVFGKQKPRSSYIVQIRVKKKESGSNGICFVDPNLSKVLYPTNEPFGGAAKDLLNQAKGFKNLNWKVYLLTDKIKNRDYASESLSVYGTSNIKSWSLLKNFILIAKKINSVNPEFITLKSPGVLNFLICLYAKVLNVKFIYQVGNDVEVDGRVEKKLGIIKAWLFSQMLMWSYGIRVQNNYQLQRLKHTFPDKSIFVVQNSMSLDNLPKPLSLSSKEYVAWIGTFRPQKRLDVLYNVAAKLPNIQFKIAGEKLSVIDSVTEEFIKKLKMLSNVEFVGFLNNPEIPDFLNKSFCLISTSDHEGFPNTFLEAWSVGVPVMTSSKVNPNNVVDKFKLGLVTEGTVSDFVSSIEKLIRDASKYKEYKSNCLIYLKKHHDLLITSKQFAKNIKA